jgi:hypothetical protein
VEERVEPLPTLLHRSRTLFLQFDFFNDPPTFSEGAKVWVDHKRHLQQ